MAISTAIQKGSRVYVYNEKNSKIFDKKGELYGFTSITCFGKKSYTVYVYNEKGSQISYHTAR
ncbi:hypothetical protein [Campylobacter magnus]|uniref:Uncharacterized protein n=1 Tax=Campylobacter magnus TaxID=3026462 RepID=A0ABT8TBH3_9BACT|nr:hypothetical protein [Campylobacter magnus]MDO2409212.1 hypothetical protein [Campylobacter magnus]